MQVLRELIAHAGSVVPREQLIALLWPKGVVDFDAGLNTVIRKLRSTLGDTSETKAITRQEKIPLRDLSRRGITYTEKKRQRLGHEAIWGHHLLTDPWHMPAPLSV